MVSALGAETVSQLLCGYGFALSGWRSRGGGEALDAFPGSSVCRVFRGERQGRRCLRSYNNELAALSIVIVIVG